MIQKDGSLNDAFCQKARLQILRGVCPVANWIKHIIQCVECNDKCIIRVDPYIASIINVHWMQNILEQHAKNNCPFESLKMFDPDQMDCKC